MRLCFPVTSAGAAGATPGESWRDWSWTATTLADGSQRLVAPPIRIEVGPLVALRDADAANQRLKQVLSADEERGERLPGQSLVIVYDEKQTSKRGWPIRLLHAVLAAPDESVLEHRLCVYYRCFGYGAEAVLRVREAEAEFYLAHQAALFDLLQSAYPDWSGDGIAALRELYE